MTSTDADMLAEFQALIDSYGARSEQWPASRRDAALALLARSPEARTRLAEAAALDALLDHAPVDAPSPALRAALLAARPEPATTGWRERLAAWLDLPGGWLDGWRPAGALAASLVLGVTLGFGAPLPTIANGGDDLLSEETFEMLAFGPDTLDALIEEIAP